MNKLAILLMIIFTIVTGIIFIPIYYVKSATLDTAYLAGFIFIEVFGFFLVWFVNNGANHQSKLKWIVY